MVAVKSTALHSQVSLKAHSAFIIVLHIGPTHCTLTKSCSLHFIHESLSKAKPLWHNYFIAWVSVYIIIIMVVVMMCGDLSD